MALRCCWLALIATLLTACGNCGEDNDSSGSTSAAAQLKPSVPAPQGLLADVFIGEPETTWRKVRLAVGGPALFLPTNIGGLLANLLSLPITVAPLIDDRIPLVGAIASPPPEPPGTPARMALAVHVKRGHSLVSQITLDKHSKYTSATEGDVVWLRPKATTGEKSSSIALAVIDNYLVMATDEQAVRKLGPYLARTLSRRKAPADDLVIEAPNAAWLAPATAEIHTLGSTLLLGGGKGDAAPIGKLVDGLLGDMFAELLSGAQSFRLTVNLQHTLTATMHLKLAQEARQRLQKLATMSATETMLSFPDDTVATATYVESRQSRQSDPKPLAKLVLSLLPRQAAVTDEHRDALSSAMASLSAGRGARTTLGVRCSGTGLTGFVLGDVHDAKALAHGFDELSALAQTKVATEMLSGASLKLTTDKTRLRHIEHDVSRIRLSPVTMPGADGTDSDSAVTEPIDLLLAIQPQRFLAAAGMNPTETLQLLDKPSQERSLGKKAPALNKTLAGLPPQSWAAMLIDVAALPSCRLAGKPSRGGPLPIALAAGPTSEGAEIRVAVPRPLLKPLFKQLSW